MSNFFSSSTSIFFFYPIFTVFTYRLHPFSVLLLLILLSVDSSLYGNVCQCSLNVQAPVEIVFIERVLFLSMSLTIVEHFPSFSGGDLVSVRDCNHHVLYLFDIHSFVYFAFPPTSFTTFYAFFLFFVKRNITGILHWSSTFFGELKKQQQPKESISFLSELCWICETKVVSKSLLVGQNMEIKQANEWTNQKILLKGKKNNTKTVENSKVEKNKTFFFSNNYFCIVLFCIVLLYAFVFEWF